MRTLVASVALVLASNAACAAPVALMIYSGEGRKTFLGCLNCNRTDSRSVCNKDSEFGSKSAARSIWNRYGDFGSKFSDQSPWSRSASDPPAIVDAEGNFYGYFTANAGNPKRTRVKDLVTLSDLGADADDPGSVADKTCGAQ